MKIRYRDPSYANFTLVKNARPTGYSLSADISEKRLSLCLGNDCYEKFFSFDEETTAKFETRFQTIGNSEAFLWKLREVYVRENDDAEKVLSRILAYCERKGMKHSESCYCSYEDEK